MSIVDYRNKVLPFITLKLCLPNTDSVYNRITFYKVTIYNTYCSVSYSDI